MSEPILLYAEDSLDDRILFAHACSEGSARFRLAMVEDGQQALDYLSGAGRYSDRGEFPIPDGVLLDIKMPILDGFDVLQWIRGEGGFSKLPVFIYTSSYQHADIQRAYAEKATAFLTKPAEFRALIRLASALYECFSSVQVTVNPLTALPQYKRPHADHS